MSGGGTTISSSETRIEALQIQSSAYGVTVPLLYGKNRIRGNIVWYGGFQSIAHTDSQSSGGKGGGVTQTNTTYTYSASCAMALCEGPITDIPQVWKDKKVYAFDGTNTAMQQLAMTMRTGAVGQATWAYLTSTFPGQAIGYSGIALATAQDYALGSSAQVSNHSFEVVGQFSGAAISGDPDANPVSILADVLTNARYGAGFPSAQLDAMTSWSQYCIATGMLLSPAITEQMQAGEFVDRLAKLTNTAPVWSNGTLKMLPYGDTAITANGATYTPNLTPIYDLTDDDFTPSSADSDPIRVSRKPQSDAYNHIRIEHVNRGNSYNVAVVEVKDSANIDAYGLRSADVIPAHWICDKSTATTVAQLMLQRSVYIRNTYQFSLSWVKAFLEPMDLVTLTDAALGLNKFVVRITEISESDSGDLDITAEEFPQGIAHHALYPSELEAGYQHDYNVVPGGIVAPVIFEAPVERTTTGLEVYAAVRGAGANWGGCRVWVSLDGNNYKDVGLIYGGSRYGALTAPVSGGNAPVSINGGQLISGSAADAANLTTLCYIGGATPEYFAYTTAALTGSLAYTLSGLTRGAFTTNNGAHAISDPFVRIDNAIGKSGPLDLSMIGKTIYFKFTSFNLYGAKEDTLAAVTAIPYTITGYMAALPPAALTGFAATNENFGIRLSCNKSLEPDVRRYEYRVGAAWATATVLEPHGGTSYLWAVQAAGTYTVWVAPVDALFNYGPAVSATATIAAPTVNALTSAINGAALLLSWAGIKGSFAISGYEVRYGASWAAGTVQGFRQASNYPETILWGGTRNYWIAAVDAYGNYGVAVSIAVTVNVPSAVPASRADVVDNNVLLYWTAPTVGFGQLPIDHYEVRKGASWVAGALVGSNGNSTFAATFEQSSGAYIYWVAAWDTGGNVGAAVGIAATVNQPPDYILRNNFDSALNGTLVNLYASGGKLLGPIDTTQTWATHYSSHSWNTPQDQINAGFPIYASPSLTTGSYEEIIDYGAALPATVITSSLSTTLISGAVTVTCTISWKLLAGDAWTVLGSGLTNALLPAFRYVRIHYDFACTAGANLIQVNGLNVKLAIKQRSDSGSGTVAVASSGAAVTFGYAFLSADTPVVQPNGATPLVPVVVYAGGVNPTGFTVYLYTLAGAQTTGSFSWSVKGY